MVLMRDRRAEQRQKSVPSELRRRAFVAMHLRETGVEKPADQLAHLLGAEALGERRRLYDVAKQDRDALEFANGKRRQRLGLILSRGGKGGAALAAEPVVDRVLGAAPLAGNNERRRAFSAEPHPCENSGVTPWARHDRASRTCAWSRSEY